MKVRGKDYPSPMKKYRRANMIIICMLLVLALGVVGFNLTEEKAKKAQKIISQDERAKNKGYDKIEKNPLVLDKPAEASESVKGYYAQLTGNSDFVESYDNVQVYVKLGEYKDTYVAFVKYEMKIKDIYTKVPGLGTLYVEKNAESGRYQVSASVEDAEVKASIDKLASHTDVKQLMSESQAAYQAAVESDALLTEALADLQNAYEESAGTGTDE